MARKVMVAMSGGVDSSVAAALLAEAGHEVVGVTMKLWGGASDTGCCSVSDVDDARRVCDHLGIEHHVFNFGEEFNQKVVAPYVADHQAGRTPNPCVECNRHIKFDRLLKRAEALGFDAVATGHHAKIVRVYEGMGDGEVAGEVRAASGSGSDLLKGDVSDQGVSAKESGAPESSVRFVVDAMEARGVSAKEYGALRLARGADSAKDQSYVLWMLGEEQLERLLLPVGEMTKQQVREAAERLGIRTAQKPDSQDVCFITRSEGRKSFLQERMKMKPAKVITTEGEEVGRVPAVELVTIGQRKNLGIGGMREPKFVLEVDVDEGTVVIGNREDRLVKAQPVAPVEWIGEPTDGPLLVQCRAHGNVAEGRIAVGLPPYSQSADKKRHGSVAEGRVASGLPPYQQSADKKSHGNVVEGRVVAGCFGNRDTKALQNGSYSADFSEYGQMQQTDAHILWSEPQPRVAPGQSIVFYEGEIVVGGTTALPGSSRASSEAVIFTGSSRGGTTALPGSSQAADLSETADVAAEVSSHSQSEESRPAGSPVSLSPDQPNLATTGLHVGAAR